MDYRILFTGKYLSAPDLGQSEPTVKINAVAREIVKDEDKGTEKARWVVYFEGKDKGMVVNKTNAILMSAIAQSNDTDRWVGKLVTLGVRKVRLGPEMVDGVRIIGSPELSEPLTVEVKMPKKKPVQVVLTATGKK